MNTKKWFAAMTVLAFASVISFFQINSYQADLNHMNGFFGWLGIGIFLGLAAIACLTQVMKSGSGNDSSGQE